MQTIESTMGNIVFLNSDSDNPEYAVFPMETSHFDLGGGISFCFGPPQGAALCSLRFLASQCSYSSQ